MRTFLSKITASFLQHHDQGSHHKQVALRQSIGICPACNKSLENHTIWLLASEIGEKQGDARTSVLKKLINSRNWSEASKNRAGDISKDMLQYLLLRCPDGAVAVLEFQSYFDIWRDDKITAITFLEKPEIEDINILVGDQWESC